MKGKWLPYGMVLLLIFLIFTLDQLLSFIPDQGKEQLFHHPVPKITIDGQEVLFKSGTFEWVEKGTGAVVDEDEPPILFHDLLPVSVKPLSTMEISFPEKERVDNISVYRSMGDLEMGNLPFETIFNHSYTFNNVAGLSTVIIQATRGEQKFHYTFPMIVEKVVAYQDQLAEEQGYLAILELYQSGTQQENWALEQVNNRYVHKAHSLQVENLEEARRLYPDFKIDSLPYYAIFNHERLLYQAGNREDFYKMLKIATP